MMVPKKTVKLLGKTFKLWKTFKSVYTAENYARILTRGNCETYIKGPAHDDDNLRYSLYIRLK